MFPKEIQVIFDARTALDAANQKDPRFDILVERLMWRLSMDKQTVLEKMVQLAQGNIHV